MGDHWNDQDIVTFAELVARFNMSRNRARPADL